MSRLAERWSSVQGRKDNRQEQAKQKDRFLLPSTGS